MSHLRLKCTKFDFWCLSVCVFVRLFVLFHLCLRWDLTLYACAMRTVVFGIVYPATNRGVRILFYLNSLANVS